MAAAAPGPTCVGSRASLRPRPPITRRSCAGRVAFYQPKFAPRLALLSSSSRRSGRGLILLALYITSFVFATTFISSASAQTTHSDRHPQTESHGNWKEAQYYLNSDSEQTTLSQDYLVGGRDSELSSAEESNNIMGHTIIPSCESTLESIKKSTSLWVFGYGSLVWKTGFKYTSKKVGRVNGFVRRFWQGDTVHRGTKKKPGRVATLEENKSGEVWGVAFELTGKEDISYALEHLGMRECALGGYSIEMIPFYPRDDPNTSFDTLVFVATPGNKNYLGEATVEQLVGEIIDSSGKAGHNVEYVTRLADFLRQNVPEIDDQHLLNLDEHLRRRLVDNSVDLNDIIASTLINDYSYMYAGQHNTHHHQSPTPVSVMPIGMKDSNNGLLKARQKASEVIDSLDINAKASLQTDENNNEPMVPSKNME